MRTVTNKWSNGMVVALPFLLIALVNRVPAQPPAGDTLQADRQAYAEVRRKVAALDASDPEKAREGAMELYREFIASRPNLHPEVAIQATGQLVGLYQKAKDTTRALEALDTALGKYGAHPDAPVLVNVKAGLLLNAGRNGEVEALLGGIWEKSLFAPRHDETRLVVPYLTALERQGKTEQAALVMRRVLTEAPLYLDDTRGASERMFRGMVEHLLTSGREDEALQWAKLRFMVCAFNEQAISNATGLLSRVWMARDLAPVTVQVFINSQKDPAVTNPLAVVNTPQISPEARMAQLASLAAVPQVGSRPVHDRISMLIVHREFGKAMAEARRLLVSQPKSPAGSLEVCRVFKAADLNVLRANAFLEFLKAGQGANPLVEFFKQYPDKGDVVN